MFTGLRNLKFSTWATHVVLAALVWATMAGALGFEIAGPPQGRLFPFIALFFAGYVASIVAKAICIPKIFGLLAAGFILINVTTMKFDPFLSGLLRNIALTTILLRGGLGLDLAVIRKLSGICIRVTFLPLIAETVLVGALGYFMLDMPLVWSFMTGFVLAAACAAITVPSMIALQEQGLGVSKGIPSIVIAAASMDDVFAITGFGVMLGVAFGSDSSTTWLALKGVIEVVGGIVIGALVGWLLSHLLVRTCKGEMVEAQLDKKQPSATENLMRSAIIFFAGCSFVFVSNAIHFEGAGPLGALVLAMVAGIRFRRESVDAEIEEHLTLIWNLTESFLFGLIGAEVKLADIDTSNLAMVFALVALDTVVRFVCTYLSLLGGNLNVKEKLFVSIAWLNKAAVQAAVGPLALDAALKAGRARDVQLAHLVITICVITILLSTPIGTLGMALTSKRFLSKSQAAV